MGDVDALRAALVAGGVKRVYDAGSVPASPTYPYAVISASPAVPQVRTLDGSGDPVGRVTVRHFGLSHASVADIAALTFATFDGAALPLPDAPVAEQEVATDVYRDPDSQGVLDVLHTYRY